MGVTKIIDVSEHNGNIDWAKVKVSDVTAVILRCGYGQDQIGQDDKKWATNVAECERLGIPYGVYLYSYAKTTNAIQGEINHTLRCLKGHSPTLPIYFDSEEPGTQGVARANAKAFCAAMVAHGYKAGIYASTSWYKSYIGQSWGYSLWIASYGSKSAGITGIDMWQYADNGSVPGISGRVDMNYGYNGFGSASQPTQKVKKTEPIDGYTKDGGAFQDKKDSIGVVSYQAHARDIGWCNWQCDGKMAGSYGQNRRIEAFRLIPVGATDVVVHVRDDGDKTYKNITKDTILGTVGENKRIEAICITGHDTFYMYRVHQKDIGWSDWANNGEWAGVKGKGLQVEAVEIKKAIFSAKAHMQNKGWLKEVSAENVVGLTGQGLRLEAFQINPRGREIKVKAHIQDIGWKDYGVITKDTIIGTVGSKKQLECLCFTGNFEYRVHLKNSGWTDWTKADGVATMGTVGQNLQIEAIQFR